ncbi:TonB-dependent siderophore receptor [Vibrio albus]|uniref:TonB-dependent siderophore receptor n=1 Tax=Vibrio albus TaxID=2200953 RepID=A0A2U3B6T4_9VIBR|nr:TonB-dependent receptor [Vibrio albus]PWI32482.1 TonB-dependent siderophore receptor [Vibrio albus]
METPFSSTNYTSELISNQQAHSVADVLQNDPTVRTTRGFGNLQEIYMIRGLPVFSDDMLVNGVYGILPRQYVAAEMLERVEVFRGSNTFLNGAAQAESAIGGSINVVPKRAGEKPLTRVTMGSETGGQAYAALDIGRRFGSNQENGIRVNLIGRNGETSVEDQERELGVISVGFDHDSERFRFSADIGYQDHHVDSPRESVTPSGTSIPSAPDASTNYAQDWTYTDDRQLFGAVRGEYDLTDDTTSWLAVGARKGTEHNVFANLSVDENGNGSSYMPYENIREDEILSSDAGIRHEFTTGSIGHTAVVSGSYYTMSAKQAYAYGYYFSPATSLYNPTNLASDMTTTTGDMGDPKDQLKYELSGISLADTMALFNEQLLVTLGARYQTIEQESSTNYDGVMDVQYDDSAVTPFAGIVYKATDNVSLYTNYAEALTPGETVSSSPTWNAIRSSYVTYANAGEVLNPYVSKQIELGIKYDNSFYGGSINLFRTTKAGALIDGNDNLTQDGEQINQGAELTMYGMPVESVKVLGGITLTDTELNKTTDGAYDGNAVIGVPEVQANLNLEWDTPFVEGLTLEGRTIYTGSQYANESNTLKVSSWTRFDLGARYLVNLDQHDLTLRARVENVADKDYWAAAGGYPGSGYLVQGNPRTVVVSASYDF